MTLILYVKSERTLIRHCQTLQFAVCPTFFATLNLAMEGKRRPLSMEERRIASSLLASRSMRPSPRRPARDQQQRTSFAITPIGPHRAKIPLPPRRGPLPRRGAAHVFVAQNWARFRGEPKGFQMQPANFF